MKTNSLLGASARVLLRKPFHAESQLQIDRREAALVYIRDWIGWVAIAVLLFMMSIGHLRYIANLHGAPLNLYAFGTLRVLYLIGIMLLVAAMVRRYPDRPDEASSR